MLAARSCASTRRTFLRFATRIALTIPGAGLMAACGALPPTSERSGTSSTKDTVPAAKPNASVAGPAKITVLVSPPWMMDAAVKDATAIYNNENRDNVIVELEEAPDGWETKALAMTRDKNLRWAAHPNGRFDYQFQYIKTQMVQPLDALLAGSKRGWTRDLKAAHYSPDVTEAARWEGKLYFLPMKLNIGQVGYRVDYLKKAGYEKPPTTWDDFDRMLLDLKRAVGGEGVVPFAIQKDLFRTLGSAMATLTKNLFDGDGVLAIESPEWMDVLARFKRYFDQGLTTTEALATSGSLWDKGKVAVGLDFHSWIRRGKQIWGSASVAGAMPPRPRPDEPPRSWIHSDSSFVFAGSPDPERGADWIFALVGADGAPAERFYRGILTQSGMPPYTKMYEKTVKANAEIPEIAEIYQVVPNSTIAPVRQAGIMPIVQAKIWPYLERHFKGELDAKSAMSTARREIAAEMAKNKTLFG